MWEFVMWESIVLLHVPRMTAQPRQGSDQWLRFTSNWAALN